jgi:threonine dehydratase
MNIDDILAARQRIADQVLYSPCTCYEALSSAIGAEVYLKLENLQITGSFKERGALNTVLQLSAEEKSRGVIAASAGNHAQAVAHAAKLVGIKARIVMPETTPLNKVQGTRAFGAEIVLHGQNYDEAYRKALELQCESDATLIHAFDDPRVMAGQGTIGLELLEQLPDLDMVVVPVGGGGLIAGIATAIKASKPEVDIIGVEAKQLPAMRESLGKDQVLPLTPHATIADGIAVAQVGRQTFPLVRRYVSEVITVGEDDIANAIMTLLEQEKTLAEGAGAVGIAALRSGAIHNLAGKKVAVVVSGGNIDMTRLSLILERGLETDQRLASITVVAPDKSGSIADLADLIASHHAKILHIARSHHVARVEIGECEIEIALETKGREHLTEIVAALHAKGYTTRA